MDITNRTSFNRNPTSFLEQPTAVINCNSSYPVTVKDDDHFECLCNSTGGNPPPTALWYKDGKVVSGPGYKRQPCH